ncbi:MAG: segregation/condensation protein A [Candidatus Pacebacteria bacterium]|nr:segregation/condensation protein A [Candidatus Paceibacterota bacterium]NUQ57406.1 segregation/condensation protein A [Candidatus Paceibacter sp.]
MHLVKTHNFEGPFGLLLELIEKKKMPVGEVSLAEIASQYLDAVKNLAEFPARDAASFLETASILMLIKSRSLLPTLELTAEEEQSIGDLERRLELYEFLRELMPHITTCFGKNPMFGRDFYPTLEFKNEISSNLSLSAVAASIAAVLNNLPENSKEILPEARVEKAIKLEEKITELVQRVQESFKICFSDFSGANCRDKNELGLLKMEIIVSFLALLELAKQGAVAVNQDNLFDKIEIQKNGQ